MQSWEKGPARSGFAQVRFESTVLTARRTPAISIFVDDHWNDSTYPLRGVAEESKSSGTKADGSELDRRGTPSYWRYFIYRTKTILSLLPHFSFVYLLLTWSGHGRPEVGIRINIRRWRTKLQAVLSAALAVRRVVVVAAADADAGCCCCCRPARKQMSDDHLVHSGHNGNDDLKPSPSQCPEYWITGRYSARMSLYVCTSNLATKFDVIDVIAREVLLHASWRDARRTRFRWLIFGN